MRPNGKHEHRAHEASKTLNRRKSLTPFGQRLWDARLKKNIGRGTFAAELGIPLPTYIKWERGERTPDAFTRRMLMDAIRRIK